MRRTVAWMDQHGKIAAAETDTFEDRLVELWEEFGTELKAKLGPKG